MKKQQYYSRPYLLYFGCTRRIAFDVTWYLHGTLLEVGRSCIGSQNDWESREIDRCLTQGHHGLSNGPVCVCVEM